MQIFGQILMQHVLLKVAIYMAGMSGAAKIEGGNSDCQLIICDQWEEKNVRPVITAAGLTKTMAPRDAKTTTETIIPRPESDVHDFYRNFCDAIDGNTKQIVTHQQLMRVMRIMEAAFLSDKMGKPVIFKE